MIVVSYHTDTAGKSRVQALVDSARRFDVPVDTEGLPGRNGDRTRAEFILRMLDKWPEHDILYVEAGGVVRRRPDLFVDPDFDVAAHVHLTGLGIPATGSFAGTGWICPSTLFFAQGDAARKVLLIWIETNAVRPDRREQDNLLYFLAAIDGVRFRYLPHEYSWVEPVMRPFMPGARPVIEHSSVDGPPGDPTPAATPPRGEPRKAAPSGVLWSGHLHDYSGYAKANRELLFRVANSIRVSIWQDDLERERVVVDGYTLLRLDAFRRAQVSTKCPFLRFYTPKRETMRGRRRICFTMMETESVHPEFVALLNDNYDEVWVPTGWNARTLTGAGLRIACSITPLGVNPHVYRHLARQERPQAKLLTTSRAGAREVPGGFAFISVFQPTFRKGIDFLVWAFESAFSEDSDACLVLATTVHGNLDDSNPFTLVGGPGKVKSRVYHLSGIWDEEEMAQLYNAFDGYVTPSRGEGWNLPMTEAAACGLPVVASRVSSHTEFLDDHNAFLFDPEGYETIPGSEKVCRWYEGQTFPRFGPRSRDEAVAHLRRVRSTRNHDLNVEEPLETLVRSTYTWDRAAGMIVERLRTWQ